MATSTGIFIVAAKRTPFGSFGGAFKNVSATQLGVAATQAALASIVNPTLSTPAQAVDAIYFGNVIPSSNDAAYLARHVALKSNCPIATPSLTINRLCGSGFETVIQAAKSIQLQESQLVIAGGTENMSAAPFTAAGSTIRWGVGLGQNLPLEDSLWAGLTDAHIGTPMGMTAENIAKQFHITRQECDEYAIRSQQLWMKAQEQNLFQAEMAPVSVPMGKKGTVVVDKDEHPRPESTLEKISKLPPVFIKETGVVTAANASGICDGAGSIILASEQAVKQYNLKPLARLVSYAVTGCDPQIMGIGPVQAIQQALLKVKWNLNDIDRIEINEAFAAQVLACVKELKVDMDKTNLHGGAISLGHPLGASGSRITAHLVHELNDPKNNCQRAVGAACIGGGQGIAIVLERV